MIIYLTVVMVVVYYSGGSVLRITEDKKFYMYIMQTMSSNAWKLHGNGIGIVGDDSVPCRNGWQAYGLYLTGPVATVTVETTTTVGTADVVGGKPSMNATTASRKARKNGKRQAVFESDLDDPASGGAAPPKSFQWFSKTFAFVKRMFTFVIIPFFKFVRNTFFQTRSLDDTVVDVSETHLTVSDIKFEPPSSAATVAAGESTSDGDSNNKVNRRSSSSKRETDDDDRCSGGRADDDRVTAADLMAAGSAPAVAVDDVLSPNAKRYLRIVSDGLNDVGVNAAFVKRAFACCSRGPFDSRIDVPVIDWQRTRGRAHDVTVSPHVCGRQ